MSRLSASSSPTSRKTIILIGMMGAGKTTIGKRLAKIYDLPFIDADSEIERAAGCDIPEIFARHGEAAFRAGEHRVIRRLIKGPPCILATGGGAWTDAETRRLVKAHPEALTIWLRAPLKTLLKRIGTRDKRPLLAAGNPEEILAALAERRYPLYAEADIIIDCGDDTVEQGAEHVKQALDNLHEPKRVSVHLASHRYDVLIGPGLTAQADLFLTPHLRGRRAVVITDETVRSLHLPRLLSSLAKAEIAVEVLSVPPGEGTKSLAQYGELMTRLLALNVDRHTTIIAHGGGVIGDLAGFVAATALRGLPFIQIPTTLLSQVDSSVGGKTGINAPTGKNLIGAFYQPDTVLIDITTLATLPRRQLVAGYAEIVKSGLIADPDLFRWCEANGAKVLEGDTVALAEAIHRSCLFKSGVVTQDECERAATGGRALLNLGHTFAHALEAEFGYDGRLLHGEAVSIGLHLATALSVKLGFCDGETLARLDAHLRSLNMPAGLDWFDSPLSAEALIAHMAHDKKIQDGRINFILLRTIGDAFTFRDVAMKTVRELLLEEGCIS